MGRSAEQLAAKARQRANRLRLAPGRPPEPQRGVSHAVVVGSSEDAPAPDVGPLANAYELLALLGLPMVGCVPGDLLGQAIGIGFCVVVVLTALRIARWLEHG